MYCFFSFFADIESPILEGQTYNYWSEFFNMLMTLGFIIGLVILSVWFLKRIMRSRIKHLNRSTGIKILEKRALTNKSSLYLVEVLGKGILIADSAAGVQRLAEIEGGINLEKELETIQQEEGTKLSFKDIMQKTLKKKLAPKNG